MTRSSVVLPQPDGPMNETNSPRAILQIDVAERLHRPVGGLEAQREPADLDRASAARRLSVVRLELGSRRYVHRRSVLLSAQRPPPR